MLEEPLGQLAFSADQLDGRALVPVERIDELDEQWLTVEPPAASSSVTTRIPLTGYA